MKRIEISQTGIAISAPGYDVTSASWPLQFLFNSEQLAPFAIFLSGTIASSALVLTGSYALGASGAYVYEYTYTLNFGTTLPNPPVAFLSIENTYLSGASESFINVTNTGNTWVYYSLTTTALKITMAVWPSEGAATGPTNISFAVGY